MAKRAKVKPKKVSDQKMIFAEHSQVEVGSIAMVINREDFDAFAAGDQIGGAVEDGIDGLA